MAFKIEWSDEAKKTFRENISWLEKEWTAKEVKKFILRTEFVILTIEEHPEIYPASTKKKKIRKAIINERISLYYSIIQSKKAIVLISFWNTYQSPKKLKY